MEWLAFTWGLKPAVRLRLPPRVAEQRRRDAILDGYALAEATDGDAIILYVAREPEAAKALRDAEAPLLAGGATEADQRAGHLAKLAAVGRFGGDRADTAGAWGDVITPELRRKIYRESRHLLAERVRRIANEHAREAEPGPVGGNYTVEMERRLPARQWARAADAVVPLLEGHPKRKRVRDIRRTIDALHKGHSLDFGAWQRTNYLIRGLERAGGLQGEERAKLLRALGRHADDTRREAVLHAVNNLETALRALKGLSSGGDAALKAQKAERLERPLAELLARIGDGSAIKPLWEELDLLELPPWEPILRRGQPDLFHALLQSRKWPHEIAWISQMIVVQTQFLVESSKRDKIKPRKKARLFIAKLRGKQAKTRTLSAASLTEIDVAVHWVEALSGCLDKVEEWMGGAHTYTLPDLKNAKKSLLEELALAQVDELKALRARFQPYFENLRKTVEAYESATGEKQKTLKGALENLIDKALSEMGTYAHENKYLQRQNATLTEMGLANEGDAILASVNFFTVYSDLKTLFGSKKSFEARVQALMSIGVAWSDSSRVYIQLADRIKNPPVEETDTTTVDTTTDDTNSDATATNDTTDDTTGDTTGDALEPATDLDKILDGIALFTAGLSTALFLYIQISRLRRFVTDDTKTWSDIGFDAAARRVQAGALGALGVWNSTFTTLRAGLTLLNDFFPTQNTTDFLASADVVGAWTAAPLTGFTKMAVGMYKMSADVVYMAKGTRQRIKMYNALQKEQPELDAPPEDQLKKVDPDRAAAGMAASRHIDKLLQHRFAQDAWEFALGAVLAASGCMYASGYGGPVALGLQLGVLGAKCAEWGAKNIQTWSQDVVARRYEKELDKKSGRRAGLKTSESFELLYLLKYLAPRYPAPDPRCLPEESLPNRQELPDNRRPYPDYNYADRLSKLKAMDFADIDSAIDHVRIDRLLLLGTVAAEHGKGVAHDLSVEEQISLANLRRRIEELEADKKKHNLPRLTKRVKAAVKSRLVSDERLRFRAQQLINRADGRYSLGEDWFWTGRKALQRSEAERAQRKRFGSSWVQLKERSIYRACYYLTQRGTGAEIAPQEEGFWEALRDTFRDLDPGAILRIMFLPDFTKAPRLMAARHLKHSLSIVNLHNNGPEGTMRRALIDILVQGNRAKFIRAQSTAGAAKDDELVLKVFDTLNKKGSVTREHFKQCLADVGLGEDYERYVQMFPDPGELFAALLPKLPRSTGSQAVNGKTGAKPGTGKDGKGPAPGAGDFDRAQKTSEKLGGTIERIACLAQGANTCGQRAAFHALQLLSGDDDALTNARVAERVQSNDNLKNMYEDGEAVNIGDDDVVELLGAHADEVPVISYPAQVLCPDALTGADGLRAFLSGDKDRLVTIVNTAFFAQLDGSQVGVNAVHHYYTIELSRQQGGLHARYLDSLAGADREADVARFAAVIASVPAFWVDPPSSSPIPDPDVMPVNITAEDGDPISRLACLQQIDLRCGQHAVFNARLLVANGDANLVDRDEFQPHLGSNHTNNLSNAQLEELLGDDKKKVPLVQSFAQVREVLRRKTAVYYEAEQKLVDFAEGGDRLVLILLTGAEDPKLSSDYHWLTVELRRDGNAIKARYADSLGTPGVHARRTELIGKLIAVFEADNSAEPEVLVAVKDVKKAAKKADDKKDDKKDDAKKVDAKNDDDKGPTKEDLDAEQKKRSEDRDKVRQALVKAGRKYMLAAFLAERMAKL